MIVRCARRSGRVRVSKTTITGPRNYSEIRKQDHSQYRGSRWKHVLFQRTRVVCARVQRRLWGPQLEAASSAVTVGTVSEPSRYTLTHTLQKVSKWLHSLSHFIFGRRFTFLLSLLLCYFFGSSFSAEFLTLFSRGDENNGTGSKQKSTHQLGLGVRTLRAVFISCIWLGDSPFVLFDEIEACLFLKLVV